ncbi:MAG: hypothetical protein OXC13_05715 [Caldilineaceae bacterium]|nr:hypothetical protein [Caldilineaceae bacterium]
MTKVAVLVDGGFFLKRLHQVRSNINHDDVRAVKNVLNELVHSHLEQINQVECVPNPRSLLYRVFYYDARPFDGKWKHPVSGRVEYFAKSRVAEFRQALFHELRGTPSTAVRLG